MSETTLIANGTVVTAEGEFAGDVLIDGETIAAVGRVDASDPTTVIDATDCYVLPGLIDNHTHLSMPFMGMWSSDDYDTGTRAAAAWSMARCNTLVWSSGLPARTPSVAASIPNADIGAAARAPCAAANDGVAVAARPARSVRRSMVMAALRMGPIIDPVPLVEPISWVRG